MRHKFQQVLNKIHDFLMDMTNLTRLKPTPLQPLLKRLSRNKPLFTLSCLRQALQVTSSNMISKASKLS